MAESNTIPSADTGFNIGEFFAKLDGELQAIGEAQENIFKASRALGAIGRMMTNKTSPTFVMDGADIGDAAAVFAFFGNLIWVESECICSALDSIGGASHG